MKKDLFSVGELPINERAFVFELRTDAKTALRLKEMGFVKGAVALMKRRSPFGFPVCVEIKNYRICIDKKTCGKIVVKRYENCAYRKSEFGKNEPI